MSKTQEKAENIAIEMSAWIADYKKLREEMLNSNTCPEETTGTNEPHETKTSNLPDMDLEVSLWQNQSALISLILRSSTCPMDEGDGDAYIEIPVEDIPQVIAMLETYKEEEG